MNPTEERVQLGGRKAVVYRGPRGGKYVKKGGEFMRLKNGGQGLQNTIKASKESLAKSQSLLTNFIKITNPTKLNP